MESLIWLWTMESSNGGISDGIVDKTVHCNNDTITDKTVYMEIHHGGVIIDETEILNPDTCLWIVHLHLQILKEVTVSKHLSKIYMTLVLLVPLERHILLRKELAKRTIEKQRRKVKTLQQAKIRLVGRITTMKGLIKHLKQKNLLRNNCWKFNGNS